jgi:hypothetical protein
MKPGAVTTVLTVPSRPVGTTGKELDMPLSKKFSLVIVGMLTVMALFSATSAWAEGETALCKVDKLTCPQASLYPAGTVLSAVISPFEPMLLWIKEPGDHIECTGGYFQVKTTTGLHKPLEGKFESFGFTNCPACTVTSEGPESTVLLLKVAPNIGEMDIHGVLIKTVCPGAECSYKTAMLPLWMEGTDETVWGKLTISDAEFLEEGNVYGCPEKVFLNAIFYLSLPEESTYITN